MPLIAAARCSESQLFAVPGSPISISARSEARVATATSIVARSPMYFGVISTPPTGASDECTTVEDHPRALKTIRKVPLPRKDTVYGAGGPLPKLWKRAK